MKELTGRHSEAFLEVFQNSTIGKNPENLRKNRDQEIPQILPILNSKRNWNWSTETFFKMKIEC